MKRDTERLAVGPWVGRLRRVEGAALVAMRVWVRGGARCETVPGQAYLVGRALTEGTAERSWSEIADQIEGRGMVLAGFGGFEAYGLALDALAADWREAIAWLPELLLTPAFPVDRCAWLCSQAAAELESQADQADALTAREFLDLLYSPNPRGRPLQGTPESLARLGPELCRDFHRHGLARGGVVALAGDFDPAQAAPVVAELLAALAAAGEVEPAPSPVLPPPAASARRREIVTRASDQAHLLVGELTVPRAHPDFQALELLGVILGAGAGLTGRIPNRIREQESLAYNASADAVAGAGLDPGRLACYVGTSPETVAQAEAAVREELTRLAAEGPSAEEVEEARAYLLGREPFRRETGRQWAEILGATELLGVPLDDPEQLTAEIRNVTLAEVAAAARRHVRPETLAVTVGLPGGAPGLRP